MKQFKLKPQGSENRVTKILLYAGYSSLFFLTLFFCRKGETLPEPTVYQANLLSMNESVTGRKAFGSARLKLYRDSLTIKVHASELAPGIMHLQHYHGFIDGRDAVCAGKEQDKNGDGIIDLIETQEVSGVTIVPFHDDPSSLKIESDAYPVADSAGNIVYKKKVILIDLENALRKNFDINELQLDKRVVYIHGISPDVSLPETVQSLPGVPAHVTLPVACGILRLETNPEQEERY